MEKGSVLRITGRSEEGAEIFTRAMEKFPCHHVNIFFSSFPLTILITIIIIII